MCRLKEIPKDIRDACKKYDPYMEYGENGYDPHLRDDAPQEAKDAYKKVYDFVWSLEQ